MKKTQDKNRVVRLSAAQLPARIDGRTFAEKQRNNLREIISMIQLAGKEKADLILFGEYANMHHRMSEPPRNERIPEVIPGRFTRSIGAAARRFHINVAIPMLGTYRGQVSSYVVMIDRKGHIRGCYQKTHPTISEQQLGMIPGNDLTTYELDFGRVGIMTCMDIEYPEVAQVLMLRGAELLLFPHVQAGWGEVDWEIRYRSRSIDTGLPMLSACYGYPAGEWSPGKMLGRSGVIGRDGGILAEKGRDIGIVACDVDLGRQRVTEFFFTKKVERTTAVTASRRPELYRDLVNIRSKEEALRKIESQEKKMRQPRRGRSRNG